MTDLQLAMIGVGIALVGGVAIYNTVQERRARRGAEKVFGERPPDALFDTDRREPTLGALPTEQEGVPEAEAEPSMSHLRPSALESDLEAGVAPTAESGIL